MTDDHIDAVASVLGQVGERQMLMSGRIGLHPTAGSDVVHLILYPAGHRVADRMRALADAPALVRIDTGSVADVGPATAAVGIGREHGEVQAQPHLGDTLVAERPINDDLPAVAEGWGWVNLSVGQNPQNGRRVPLDRYVRRARHLYIDHAPLTGTIVS